MVLPAVARAVRALELVDQRILVAVSGGIDSTILLHALHALAPRHALRLVVGHVNHGLRGPESAADQRFVEVLAAELGLPVRSVRADPESLREGRSSRDRPTLQEAARSLRYAALEGIAAEVGADRIATAHTADDQAETVLLRLLRGSGPDGLAGIPERSPDQRIVRPLLRVDREAISAYASSRGLRWREDSSNRSRSYARNRLRNDWIPGLREQFNPRLLRAIGDLAEAQRRDSEWIAAQVEREAKLRFREEAGGLRIDRRDWAALPDALARRLARAALQHCGRGREVSRVHLERFVQFVRSARPGTRIELPGGLVLRCTGPAVLLTVSRLRLEDAC